MPINEAISPPAYAMGRTSGCGTCEYVVKAGTMSPPLNVMYAPLLPICAWHSSPHVNMAIFYHYGNTDRDIYAR
jgi:hypothetical protein